MNKETTDVDKFISMIKDVKYTMFSTVSSDGSVHSRPMATQTLDPETFDGTLWFFSKKNSIKNHAIENDQHVNLTYISPSNQGFVSVCGRASISESKTKMEELWRPILKEWFPEGINDPEISLIAVDIESAEVWDLPPTMAGKLVDFVKTAVTGKLHSHNVQGQHINLQGGP
jgi:general stress protein 26